MQSKNRTRLFSDSVSGIKWSFFGSNLVAYFDVLFETNFGAPKMQNLYNSSHIRYLCPKFEQTPLVKDSYLAREIRGIAVALSRVFKKSRPRLETKGGRALQGLVTPLELVVSPYLRRRRAARPARASRESVAVVGSGMGAVV